MGTLRIAGGHVIDPANGVDAIGDVWIQDGRVIAPPSDPAVKADRTINARGYVVMPGGVDIHSHIAGPKVNAARSLRPEDRPEWLARRPGFRSGTLGSVPTTFATGYTYAGLGYTTAVDAAVPPLAARHAHHELRDTPVIDKALLVLLGNNHYVMDRVREGDRNRLKDYIAWLLGASRAFGVKVVNPGGVERWKQGGGNVSTLDDAIDHFAVTPRRILEGIATATDELGLPHPVHVHGLNLGLPGNAATTLETMQALEGRRAHFAHIQFHSYGGDPGRVATIDSQVPLLADHLNSHPGLSVDVGQVLFGDTTSMTADGAVGQYLHDVTGRKWISHDVEQETGCGIVPITYDDRNAVHALQWAIGLEWYLRVEDPWRIAMSTDHPNGGSFRSYPRIIALLMSETLRHESLGRLPPKILARSGLGDLRREYTLSEIAIITRAAPARRLGLTSKGHLGIGADADATIYSPDDDRVRMFSLPRWVIKAGEVVIDDGEPRVVPGGSTLHVAPGYDPAVVPHIAGEFERWSSLRFAHYAPDEAEVARPRPVPCGGTS
jgi:formylmethanofuran dehydrogenase subunit A